jgi:hypothetical protein
MTATWRQALSEVGTLTDQLGTEIDLEIADTVTAFWLLGINTVSSCAGHIGRITGGPYVMLEDPTVAPLVATMRSIGDPRSPHFKKIRAEVVRRNLTERQKLLPLLDAFYRTRQSTPYENRIIIESVGPRVAV